MESFFYSFWLRYVIIAHGDTMKKIVNTHSYEETRELGKAFANTLNKGALITLEGDLGVGKTAFTKGIGLGLGIEEPIVSPTFTLLREYEGRLKLNHIDAYRLEGMSSDPLALFDLMDDDALVVIEWSNYVSEANLDPDYKILIEYIGENERRITIEGDTIGDFNS